MFEARPSLLFATPWVALEWIGVEHRYLCNDGEVREASDPTFTGDLVYYPTQAAALAAIHAHYHDDATETIDPDQIPARLEEVE